MIKAPYGLDVRGWRLRSCRSERHALIPRVAPNLAVLEQFWRRYRD
jgi:hypothetical protein